MNEKEDIAERVGKPEAMHGCFDVPDAQKGRLRSFKRYYNEHQTTVLFSLSL